MPGRKGWELLRGSLGRLRRSRVSGAFALITLGIYCASAAADTGSVEAATPFWQQLLIAIAGPAAATVFGGIWAQLIVDRVQRARKQAELAAQDRLRDHDTKMQLIQEMSVAAQGLYFALRLYFRATERTSPPPSEEVKAALRRELDAQYRVSGVSGAAIETRLKLLFAGEEPCKYWHAARDILTVHYFRLVGLATDGLIAVNACDHVPGEWHSGLTKDELKNWKEGPLFDAYRDRLDRAIEEVLKQPMTRPSSQDTAKVN